jgi:hypothetical protein
MMNEILSESQLKKMGVKNYPMKKLEEIPILPKNQSLRWQSPMSMKLKWLQKSMRELALNLMLEPTEKQKHLWSSKKNQRLWSQTWFTLTADVQQPYPSLGASSGGTS